MNIVCLLSNADRLKGSEDDATRRLVAVERSIETVDVEVSLAFVVAF
jgi:hypothetical protein